MEGEWSCYERWALLMEGEKSCQRVRGSQFNGGKNSSCLWRWPV